MLHIVNKSHTDRGALASCLRLAQDGSTVLLIEDGIYAATTGAAQASGIAAATGRFKVYVLQPDLDARGMGDKLIAGVSAVDYGGFVDLAVTNNSCQSWL